MKRTAVIAIVAMVAFTIACGSSQQVEKDYADPNAALVSAQNQQLEEYPVKGFAYKSSKMPEQKWDKWADVATPVVKEIINKLPEGYVLQVTGHADATGPEQPTGNKPGNIKISKDRAKTVYNALKRKDVDTDKITYEGVGSSEPIPGSDPRAAKNRRVTFKVVPE
ncbi:MAG: OmpA family protein [Bacteroidota bacterium]